MAILTAEFWAKIVDRMFRVLEKQGFAIFFGVTALGMSIAFMVMIWHAGGWVGKEVVLPVRDAHIQLTRELASSNAKTAEGVMALSDGVEKMADSMESMDRKLSRVLPEDCR